MSQKSGKSPNRVGGSEQEINKSPQGWADFQGFPKSNDWNMALILMIYEWDIGQIKARITSEEEYCVHQYPPWNDNLTIWPASCDQENCSFVL